MPMDFRTLSAGVPLTVLLATFAIGAVGGTIGVLLGLPLGMLLGALIAVGTSAALGLQIRGAPVAVPQSWRFVLIPIIGVAIGATFTPELLSEAPAWGLSLLLLVVYVPVAHFLGYLIYKRIGGIPSVTAYYAAIPGGLIESLQMGEDAGADIQMLTMLQFLRLILAIVLVPLGFTIITGHTVGSASGVQFAGSEFPLLPVDVAILLICAYGGVWVGRRLRLPAPIISGPIIASAAAHLTGLTNTVPPEWAIVLTQFVVGTSLGARFAGMRRAQLGQAIWLATIYSVMALSLALVAALLLGGRVGEPGRAVFLAFAPGGIAEMTLVAISLQVSVVFVSLHHIVRILLAVSVARLFSHRIK